MDWQQLPTRVEAAIAQRIGSLSPQLQRLLKVAAVEGELFTAEVIARVLGQRDHDLIQQLSDHLSQQAQLVEGQASHHVASQRLSQCTMQSLNANRSVWCRDKLTTTV